MQSTVLIAEDDKDIRELLKLYLESEGYRILGRRMGVLPWNWPKRSSRTWQSWM